MSKTGIPLVKEEVEKKLGHLVLEIILNKATVSFPLSSVGVPSPIVVISGTSTLKMDLDQWRLCVLPVVQDPSFAILRTPKGNDLVRSGQLPYWKSLIDAALEKSFETNGF